MKRRLGSIPSFWRKFPCRIRGAKPADIALSPMRDTLIEGFSHFVSSMTAPIASGWSGCRVGLAPTGKRRLVTAHTQLGHPIIWTRHSSAVLRPLRRRAHRAMRSQPMTSPLRRRPSPHRVPSEPARQANGSGSYWIPTFSAGATPAASAAAHRDAALREHRWGSSRGNP